MAVLVVEFWEIGLPGGLPPPRAPGPGASSVNRGGAALGRPAPNGGAAAFGRRPPILGTPVGAGGARSGRSGGREPPRKANFPKFFPTVLLGHSDSQSSRGNTPSDTFQWTRSKVGAPTSD